MVGGAIQSSGSDYEDRVDDMNIAYRLNAGQRYQGNFKVDWWYYDPVGPAASPTVGDYIVVGYYGLPLNQDYTTTSFSGTQIIWLGAYPFTGYNYNVYQAKITGETDGVNGGQDYNTTGNRSIGWHHFRLLFGVPNGANTPVSFFIDDMVNPAMTHTKFFSQSLDCIEINTHQYSTSDATGYFDDWSLQSATDPWIVEQPVSATVQPGGQGTLKVVANGTGYQWYENGTALDGQTTATLYATDVATYTCVVTGALGSVTSAPVVLANDSTMGTGTGLLGLYSQGDDISTYSNIDLSTPVCTGVIDSQVFFNGAGQPAIPPSCPSLTGTNFNVRWTGLLQPPYSDTYTFYTMTDDGVRLWVNNKLVIDHWGLEGPTEWWSAGIPLQAGQLYAVKMEYFQHCCGDYYSLSWASDNVAKQLVPAGALYPYGLAPIIITDVQTEYGNPGDTVDLHGCSPAAPYP